MESAGKLVDDEEMAEALKEKGLGTPATRASTIEHLLKEKYVRREGTQLHPTLKAEDLFQFLDAAGTDVLTSPSLTGEWEHKLRKIEEKEMTREQFMEEISKMTVDFVEKTTNFKESKANFIDTPLRSPLNDEPLYEGLTFYQNEEGDFRIPKSIAGRRLPVEEVDKLIKERRIGPLDDFISKAGRKFSAILQLDDDYKVNFVFENDEEQVAEEIEQAKTAPTIAPCPLCESERQANRASLRMQQAQENSRRHLFIQDHSQTPGQGNPSRGISETCFEKKTGLIKGFVSRRTKRPFDANLILKDDGGIGFEFPPARKNRLEPKSIGPCPFFNTSFLTGKTPKRSSRLSKGFPIIP